MTAVEWLDRWFRDNPEATHEEGNNALQQAKEMEKKMVIDIVEKSRKTGLTTEYLLLTYGSKGSDETKTN